MGQAFLPIQRRNIFCRKMRVFLIKMKSSEHFHVRSLCSEDFVDRIVPGGANIPEGSHISGRGLHLKRHSTQDWLIHQKMCTLYRNHV